MKGTKTVVWAGLLALGLAGPGAGEPAPGRRGGTRIEAEGLAVELRAWPDGLAVFVDRPDGSPVGLLGAAGTVRARLATGEERRGTLVLDPAAPGHPAHLGAALDLGQEPGGEVAVALELRLRGRAAPVALVARLPVGAAEARPVPTPAPGPGYPAGHPARPEAGSVRPLAGPALPVLDYVGQDFGHLPPEPPTWRGHAHGHGGHGADPEPVAAWTCPMHPEVVRDAPGRCPHCGMDLVPRRAP